MIPQGQGDHGGTPAADVRHEPIAEPVNPTMSGNKKAGGNPGGWNEGVGEHVRIKSQPLA